MLIATERMILNGILALLGVFFVCMAAKARREGWPVRDPPSEHARTVSAFIFGAFFIATAAVNIVHI